VAQDVEGQFALLESMKTSIDFQLEQFLLNPKQAASGEVARLAKDVVLAGGKRLRPILILLAYQASMGKDMEEILPLALAFELIHTATLVHDDINDQADTRRGRTTIHAGHGIAKGIIAGDWLFVQGFGLGGRYDEHIVNIMAHCCAEIAAAEYRQLNKVLDISTTPEDYFSIVKGKTAGPFAAGCQAAGLVAGLSSEQADKLFDFGMQLGIAYQLVDDLLDLRGDERMGKPRGADVYEGKMTLPIIHALTLSHGEVRTRLAEILERFDDSYFDEFMALLHQSQSIEYVEILIKTHLERAREILTTFEESQARQTMLFITEVVANRDV